MSSFLGFQTKYLTKITKNNAVSSNGLEVLLFRGYVLLGQLSHSTSNRVSQQPGRSLVSCPAFLLQRVSEASCLGAIWPMVLTGERSEKRFL